MYLRCSAPRLREIYAFPHSIIIIQVALLTWLASATPSVAYAHFARSSHGRTWCRCTRFYFSGCGLRSLPHMDVRWLLPHWLRSLRSLLSKGHGGVFFLCEKYDIAIGCRCCVQPVLRHLVSYHKDFVPFHPSSLPPCLPLYLPTYLPIYLYLPT